MSVLYALKAVKYLMNESGTTVKDTLRGLYSALILKKQEGLAQVIRLHAEKRGSKPAILWEGGSRTYRELLERSEALARFLHRSGLKPGARVALMGINTPEMPEVWTALNIGGYSLIPVNWRLKAGELRYIMENSESDTIIFHTDIKEEVMKTGLKYRLALEIDPSNPESDYEKAIEEGMKLKDEPVEASEPSEVLIYTSGTTGRPKGARRSLSPAKTMIMVSSAAYEFGLRSSDIHLATCPLYHSAPFFFAELHLVLGATVVILPRFRVEWFFRAVDRFKVTTTFIVPFMVSEILDHYHNLKSKYSLSSLRRVICAAAPLSPHMKIKFKEMVGPVLYEFYGATETGINTILRPEDIPEKAESVGRPMPMNKIKIFDDSGHECPVGEEGVIYIKSPFIIQEYYKDPDATRSSKRKGYFTAGDMGKLDEDGYLYVLDRKKDMIISAGVNIYPAEIENELLKHPAVKAVAVVGVPDEKWGEKVKAFIVLKEGAKVTFEELEKFLRERIAGYKIPRAWAFIDSLPMTPSGKVLKRELRKMN